MPKQAQARLVEQVSHPARVSPSEIESTKFGPGRIDSPTLRLTTRWRDSRRIVCSWPAVRPDMPISLLSAFQGCDTWISLAP